MESLDRPYGDDETDYVTVEPELTGENADDEPARPLHPNDLDDHATDPAFQAVEEGGGGVSEGFEAAEGQLIDNIENAPDADRTLDGFDRDEDVEEDVADDVAKTLEDHDPGDNAAVPRDDETRRATAVYGEADHIEATEVVRDPDGPADDPGEGPGIASDR